MKSGLSLSAPVKAVFLNLFFNPSNEVSGKRGLRFLWVIQVDSD